MSPFLRSRASLIGLVVTALALGAIGFVPLFDGPGYEAAVAAGLVLPFTVAITTAIELGAVDRRDADPFATLARGAANGAAFAAVAYLLCVAHGLRSGLCDFAGGSAHFAIGPAPGAVLAGAWGAVAAEPARRVRVDRTKLRVVVAVAAGAAGPLASMLVSGVRFYTSPMIFAYDPFVGYFSGTLYDTVIDARGLLSYRAGTAATLVALGLLSPLLGRTPEGRLALVWRGRRPGLVGLGIAALIASVTLNSMGHRLGHWHTASTIAEALGGRVSGSRCDVIYPRSMATIDVERFAKECDAHVEAGERWFSAKGPARLTAYLFTDAGQKASFMGAADTFIAKPWRREVYVQAGGYPHPVLGHEVMHVIAGAFARGPFRIAGSAGGLLPDPGLIEGTAVAAAPREGDLTPREWAKAMRDLGILPPLQRLFALSFLSESSATAYTVSGAFVELVHERWGAVVVRAWYGGASLPALTGKSWPELERIFHEDLDRTPLDEAARVQAKARFERTGVFSRRCPHVIDGCKSRAERLRGGGDDAGAIDEWRRVLALDPRDTGSRFGIARAAIRRDPAGPEGRRLLLALADDASIARASRDRALEDLADLDLSLGDAAGAAARYRAIAPRINDEDRLRTLEIKIFACEEPAARPAIVALLLGKPGKGPDRSLATELITRWAERDPRDGTPLYLLGRTLYNAGSYEDARDRIDRALAGKIQIERVRVEAERLRLVIACALGERAAAERALAAFSAHPGVTRARREAHASLFDRSFGEGRTP